MVLTHLIAQNIRKIADGEKHELTQEVQASEDVQFHWCILAVDMSVEISEPLLKMIIDMWITIQGFSFANWILVYTCLFSLFVIHYPLIKCNHKFIHVKVSINN